MATFCYFKYLLFSYVKCEMFLIVIARIPIDANKSIYFISYDLIMIS